MLKVVFDTVVFVRCLINPRGRWGRMVFSHHGSYRLVVSGPILLEVFEVLERPELVDKFRTLPGLDRRRLLDILAQAESVEVALIPAASRDPKDDKFLATAVAAGADYLVSEDRDLLDLVSYAGIPIVSAEQFLAVLKDGAV